MCLNVISLVPMPQGREKNHAMVEGEVKREAVELGDKTGVGEMEGRGGGEKWRGGTGGERM